MDSINNDFSNDWELSSKTKDESSAYYHLLLLLLQFFYRA
jgi:hypothetical protein